MFDSGKPHVVFMAEEGETPLDCRKQEKGENWGSLGPSGPHLHFNFLMIGPTQRAVLYSGN